MASLIIDNTKYNLSEMDGDTLLDLSKTLIDNLEYFSNRHIEEDYDLTKEMLDELLEYIIFFKK